MHRSTRRKRRLNRNRAIGEGIHRGRGVPELTKRPGGPSLISIPSPGCNLKFGDMMNRTIEFTIPGDAVPFARAGGGKNTPRFTPAKQRSYMGVVKLFCQRAMQAAAPMEGAIELSVSAYYLRPKSHTRKRAEAAGAIWKTSKPDADNLSKLVKDALNTVAWRDDAQVVSLHVWKQYSDTARLSVRIVELAEAA